MLVRVWMGMGKGVGKGIGVLMDVGGGRGMGVRRGVEAHVCGIATSCALGGRWGE